MTVVQTLTLLCPTEYKNAAYLRNFANLGITAVKGGKLSLALRCLHSTISHIGLVGWLRAASPALIDSLMIRISIRLSHKIVVAHEPASTIIGHSHE
jgi:hypothetical protein